MIIQPNNTYLGDCLELLNGCYEGSIDMILCDPPYGTLNKKNEKAAWDKPIDLQELWKHYRRILKKNGVVILFSQGLYTAELMLSCKDMWRYNLVWDKCTSTGFLNANRMPMRQHENISVFYRKQPTFHPQMRKCLPSERNHGRGNLNNTPKTNSCYGNFGYTNQEIKDEKFPTSIISIPREHRNGAYYHPTQKPVELMRYLIRTYSNPGEVILDNCMGSGTTCVAAILKGREYIGMEKEESFYHIANERIKSIII